jgi:predicted acylesterase/phospholipase RssA
VVVEQRFCTYRSFKVLEEAGVKIDYIGGTSMGAVVGLYATGYNAAQIDSVFRLPILMN